MPCIRSKHTLDVPSERALFGSLFILSLFLQRLRGYSGLDSSLIQMLRMLLMFIVTPSGLNTLFRRIGGNLGYVLVTSQVVHRTAFHRARLLEHLTPYDPGLTLALDNLTARLAGAGLPPGTATDSALKMLGGLVNRHATMMAYNNVF
jgi:hypothetical protein